MGNNPLLDQAEDFLTRCHAEGTEIHGVLRPLIDAARAGIIPDDLRSSATELQNTYPTSTVALLIQRILQGGKDPIDLYDLKRRIAAENSEKGPKYAARADGRLHTHFDLIEPGPSVIVRDGQKYDVIVERTTEGYSAQFPAFPQFTTRAPSASEALSKAYGKLHTYLKNRDAEPE